LSLPNIIVKTIQGAEYTAGGGINVNIQGETIFSLIAGPPMKSLVSTEGGMRLGYSSEGFASEYIDYVVIGSYTLLQASVGLHPSLCGF